MVKVVYNNCYGGFSLSNEAILRAREISGNPNWGFDNDNRHDPILVQVVEELKEKVNDNHSNLTIVEINSRRYKIYDYDGLEEVIISDDYE